MDYVLSEALEKPVQEIRYKNSRISFETRNHYFTQWIGNNQKYLFNPIRDNCATKNFDKANPEIAKVCWTDNLSKLENDSEKSVSLHSYAAAVDLTIENLDMGSEFDSFDPPNLTSEQIKNRNLLKSVMQKAGFSGSIKSEWWHFEPFSLEIAKKSLR